MSRSVAGGLLAALLLLGGTTPAAAQALGRLFFTPEQRAMLETLRQSPASSAPAAADRVTVNGIITRSGGGATVWINGVPQTRTDKAAPAAVPVLVPGTNTRVLLKPGQSVEMASGAVSETRRAPAEETVKPEPPKQEESEAAVPPSRAERRKGTRREPAAGE